MIVQVVCGMAQQQQSATCANSSSPAASSTLVQREHSQHLHWFWLLKGVSQPAAQQCTA
jgi:hypothetical protein